MFLSSTGKMIVAQSLALRNNNSDFNGVAGLVVELDFFQSLLDKLTIGKYGVIAIADTNMKLLARKPLLTKDIGTKVNDKIVEEFILSNENYKNFRSKSPLDGINRLYGVRKVADLPFIIVVGEADKDWLANWKQKTFGTIVVIFIFYILAILILRNHWKQLQLRKELDYLAHTDDLTGISNHRDFINQANQELKRIHRYQTKMALLTLDIDRFKLINDTYGHATGDKAIIEFTKICKASIRNIDILGRLGGDEFAILLLDTNIEEVRIVVERIRLAIESCTFSSDNGEIVSMTSSIGVAIVDSKISSVNEMMAISDRAVYLSKEKGRNRVEIAK